MTNQYIPPKIWTKHNGITSLGASLPAAAIVMVKTGFMAEALKRNVNNKMNAYVAPIANGLPVAITTYVKKRAPKNSAK